MLNAIARGDKKSKNYFISKLVILIINQNPLKTIQ